MNTPNKITREYRIDAGNSATGPVGLVAYIMAESPEKALEIAIEKWDQEGYTVEDGSDHNLLIYVNPQALTLADVWEVETDRRCAPPEATAEEKMLAALVMIDEDEEDLIHGRTPRHGFSAIKMARQLALAAARKGGAL